MAESKQIDQVLFSELRTHAADLESMYQTRNENLDAIEAMYMMEWETGKPSDPSVQSTITISPSARNAAIGAIRLMTATEPGFNVPFDENQADAGQKSDKVEQWCRAVWNASGRARQRPVHLDGVTSAVLFNEVHILVTSTQYLLEHYQSVSQDNPRAKAAQMRLQRLAEITPYILEVYDPRSGYPEYDPRYGLIAYYRKVKMRVGNIQDTWGQAAIDAGVSAKNRTDEWDYCDWWDDVYHAVWVNDKALLVEEHGLEGLPIVAQKIEGSESLFSKIEYRNQPFLYTLQKSGLWERENLALTAIYSSVFRLAAMPQTLFVKQAGSDHHVTPDYSVMGGTIEIEQGEEFEFLDKKPVDPMLLNSLTMAQDMGAESTIFKQALGQPLGSNAPFSMVALLNQTGRLPLTPIQRMCSSAFGKAMEICLTLVKGGAGSKVKNAKNNMLELKASDIPDGLTINCKVEIDLPQDDRQNSATAVQLTSGDNPLTSKRWARENLLHIPQSNQMDKEIWLERYIALQAQLNFQQQAAQAQQAAQTQASAQNPMQGGPAGLPQGPDQSMQPPSPEMMAQQPMQQPGAQMPAGMDVSQLPPEILAQMQGQAGAGQPGMPMTGPVQPGGG
jgi:hypothetical protein